MVGKRITRVSRGYHYFFVRPRGRGNAHLTAERLMRIRNVREVSITEGAYGFIVKANDIKKNEADVAERINRAVGGDIARAVSRCQYVRQQR